MTQRPPAPGLRADVEERMAEVLARVGERVREARMRVGMSRRHLSEVSDVSQRYLAQLETGQGNISIGLLMRVADALGMGLEALVAADDPWTSETGRLARLIQGATEAQRAQVLRLLEAGRREAGSNRRVALIGLRGAGKSTLGRRAAERLGVTFMELNHEIGRIGGMPVGEIMALYGQEGYRVLERQALDGAANLDGPLVLAVAGGVVANPGSLDFLLRNFLTLWLKATPEEHMQRVLAQGDSRPMAGTPNAMTELRAILTTREALYAEAHRTLDTTGQSVDDSLARLLAILAEAGFPAAPSART